MSNENDNDKVRKTCIEKSRLLRAVVSGGSVSKVGQLTVNGRVYECGIDRANGCDVSVVSRISTCTPGEP